MSEYVSKAKDIDPGWGAVVKEWLKVARCVQSQGSKTRGAAIVNLSILINERGRPIVWTEPRLTRIEPASRGVEALSKLLRELDCTL